MVDGGGERHAEGCQDGHGRHRHPSKARRFASLSPTFGLLRLTGAAPSASVAGAAAQKTHMEGLPTRVPAPSNST